MNSKKWVELNRPDGLCYLAGKPLMIFFWISLLEVKTVGTQALTFLSHIIFASTGAHGVPV